MIEPKNIPSVDLRLHATVVMETPVKCMVPGGTQNQFWGVFESYNPKFNPKVERVSITVSCTIDYGDYWGIFANVIVIDSAGSLLSTIFQTQVQAKALCFCQSIAISTTLQPLRR